ncbi:hypothetical protein FE257_000207 [Aspergillus nanangensis]|uniref:SRR1-like domain-containing protein n=1 Tax=Aspergillus nanangensis TaxID=2582783 RepID=A0AAD4H122_ASPNN|nr:hypothetical protein FE257_000207 [Aspergillus nanangensis]
MVHNQLQEHPARGALIRVRGFDNEDYHYPVRTGEKVELREEVDGGPPHVTYRSIEDLKNPEYWSLRQPYINIGIAHSLNVAPHEESLEGLHLAAALGQGFLNTIRQHWKLTPIWTWIESTLTSLNLEVDIRKVIGMGCGELTDRVDLRQKWRGAARHALLLQLAEYLQRSAPENARVACYENPGGFLQMDGTSLVFSSDADICVKQIIADIARPAILILNTVRDITQGHAPPNLSDPDSPRVLQMIHMEYDQLPFPYDRFHNFPDMSMYVRKGCYAGNRTSLSEQATASRA